MSTDSDPGATLRSLYAMDGGVKAVFSGKVADYLASRPGYPAALFEMLRAQCAPQAGMTVADVGAGTGLLTQGLLQCGYRVVAVEPNADMRRAADLLLYKSEGYRSAEGCAESMPLASASVQLITAAQAFHWFEVERARAEFLRVLSLSGVVALIWNDRVLEDPLAGALDEVFGEFGGTRRAALVAHEEDRAGMARFFGLTHPQQFSWPHQHHLDEAGLLSLVFSRSYMPGRDSAEGCEAKERTNAVFRRFAADGTVAIRYRTGLTLGRPV